MEREALGEVDDDGAEARSRPGVAAQLLQRGPDEILLVREVRLEVPTSQRLEPDDVPRPGARSELRRSRAPGDTSRSSR